jgi:nitroreductase
MGKDVSTAGDRRRAMDLIKEMEERRSTRAFLERLLNFATRAPSAINLPPWEMW